MIDPSKLLTGIPEGLRAPLFSTFQEIAANYAEHRWEPSELNGGKFCEVVYSILLGALKGVYPTRPSKPKNMVDACAALGNEPPNFARVGDRSIRILIPRVLPALYEIRNNRGVGHVGGDVDPNFLDATAVYSMASWILAELVRIFHAVSTIEAQVAVDALIERKHPLIWEVGDIKRVLDPAMETKDQILVLLHQHAGWISEKELTKWVEYSTVSNLRKRALAPLHKKRLLEFDQAKGQARISPLGIKEVEQRIIKSR